MKRIDWLLHLRYLFDAVLVITSFAIGVYDAGPVTFLVVGSLVLIAAVRTYVEYQETAVQPTSEQLRTVLEDEVFPKLRSEYESCVDDPPDVRINVMLARRRNIAFWRGKRRVWPWERTLKMEAWSGDYERNGEHELEWRTFEGVAGAAMNDKAQETWSNLDAENVNVQTEWHLTDTQMYRTDHLNSVLSVPIYLPSDSALDRPVGVLNLDSRDDITRTHFDAEAVRDTTIYYANLVGAIVE